MSGFLSKSKQRLEHTNKLNVGEFKTLGGLLGQEKSLLNSHIRVASDLRKASHALDEWAQSEGPDLADTLGKVTKLLANDLAKAEEEYADHLSNFRMYFKQLRTREERFSQLKKNKDSLQGKIDAAEKKLAKMSPEHKDLATLSQKLADLRNEMVGMEHSVMNEEAAIGDNRRQTARSAVTHQLAALCQLGEKMTIIGELGKLLTYEIRLDKTEPGRDRVMYNGYDRTLQIYGEAQTCLHKVVFDANSNEPAYGSLPVPQQSDFDQSYEYEQEAQRGSNDGDQQRQPSKRSSLMSPVTTASSGPYQSNYQGQQSLLPPGAGERQVQGGSTAPYQPLATPEHVGTENEFSDAVNATFREQQQENAYVPALTPQPTNQYQPYHQPGSSQAAHTYFSNTQQPDRHGVVTEVTSAQPSPGLPVQPAQETSSHHEDPYGGQELSREEDSYDNDEVEYVPDDQPLASQQTLAPPEREGITTIDEETSSAIQATELSSNSGNGNSNRGVGGFANPSASSSGVQVQRHQLHDRPVPVDPDYNQPEQDQVTERPQEQQYTYTVVAPAAVEEELPPPVPSHDDRLPSSNTQKFVPTGEDLEGTGLYGGPATNANTTEEQVTEEPAEIQEARQPESPGPVSPSTRGIPMVPIIAEPAPSYTARVPPPMASPTVSHHSTASSSAQRSNQADIATQQPRQVSNPLPSPNLASASALAAAAASSIRPRQSTGTSSKSSSKPHSPVVTVSPHVYTTVATSSKSPTTPTVPSSPPHREKTPPAKQLQSYRSEHRNRQNSNEAMGRSSIAYLNDIPSIEPPMRAPPPTNLGMPLPSSSPYFNPYANLRNSSGGAGDHAASVGGAPSGASGRPKGARTSTQDTTLGSKHGFALTTAPPAHERPLLQQPIANMNANAIREKDYSYAIRTGDDGGGRRLAAGAFRRANPSSSSIPSFRSGEDVSPAQRLRDEWRTSQSFAPTPSPGGTEFVTPAQTPAGIDQTSTPRQSYIESEEMYGDRANSRAPFSHRTSAIDAPMDVLANDDSSHSDLHHIAEGGEETVLPLNVRKKSPNSPPMDLSENQQQTSSDGFNGGQFVTRLE